MISEEKKFYFRNGTRAANLRELEESIRGISQAEFQHYVNPYKNDFASWAENVFGEQVLGEALLAAKTKEETLNVLQIHLGIHTKNQQTHEKLEEERGEKKNTVHGAAHEASDIVDAKSKKADELLGSTESDDLEIETIEDGPANPRAEEVIEETEDAKIIRKWHDLSEKELKVVACELQEELTHEEMRGARHIKESERQEQPEISTGFIVREFIYGLTIGFIFGAMLIGMLLNLPA